MRLRVHLRITFGSVAVSNSGLTAPFGAPLLYGPRLRMAVPAWAPSPQRPISINPVLQCMWLLGYSQHSGASTKPSKCSTLATDCNSLFQKHPWQRTRRVTQRNASREVVARGALKRAFWTGCPAGRYSQSETRPKQERCTKRCSQPFT